MEGLGGDGEVSEGGAKANREAAANEAGDEPSDEAARENDAIETGGEGSKHCDGVTLAQYQRLVWENRAQLGHFVSLRAWFASLDAAGVGYVTRTQLRAGLEAAGVAMPSRTLDDMFAEADVDKDGKVCFWEFERVVTAAAPAVAAT